ncbi:acetate--CoA ligase family protein [Aquabacter sp. CN5-332]|uniref:acetate--CoA ligase family protein n=1 Tax=Aquabacter sp. CN5-332 TaxID=3156608 RepID=UPI0032B62365
MTEFSGHGYYSAKRELLGHRELGRLVDPRSIAVVGASNTPGSFGRLAVENIQVGYEGRIYPVNPRYEEVLGLPCYPSLEALPEAPDCVIVTVAREHVEAQVERAAAIGAGGVILYSAGYAEVAQPERIEAQYRLSRIAHETGMRILGPNCLGIVNCVLKAGMTFMPKFREMPLIQGPIGLVSQSGGLGYVVVQAMERGVGFSRYLSAGNSCDIDVSDLVNYLVEDHETKVIACMLEGVRDGDRLVEASRRALAADKPLLIYKLGNGEISQRTAMSHTGTLAGGPAAYRAAFERTGAVIIDNWEELLETANWFATAGRPLSGGVGVMANSGGAAVMAADKAEEHGVDLPLPSPETSARLAKVIPDFGSNANPSDITAESLKNPDMFGECIRAFADDPSFAAVVVPMLSAHRPATVERAKYVSDLAATLPKPLCIVWLNEWLEGPGSEVYDASRNLAMFRSMGRCFKAVRLWFDHYARRDALLQSSSDRVAPEAGDMVRERLRAHNGSSVLSEAESKHVLGHYGVMTTRERLVQTEDEAARAAGEIGYPVVLKVDSSDIPHKTEAGVVRLRLSDETRVRSAYREIMAAAGKLPGPPRISGVSVQQMVGAGAELMIGTKLDAQFGPLVVCGFGGVAVEVTRDVASALAPVTKDQALDMIRSLRGYKLLDGFRGQPRHDVSGFAEMVARVSELAADLKDEIAEIDVNPVILSPSGGVAVDALIVRQGEPA